MEKATEFRHPLIERYASREMAYIFSDQKKFTTWRALWVALAEAERELGLPITQEQIDELKSNQNNLNLDVAKEEETKLRHDVMAHIRAYARQCPKAGGIIHLGATSAYVGDNTDVLVVREALQLLAVKLANLVHRLSNFAMERRALPTLGFTHLQPAQPTTVGKRAALWAQEFLMDLKEVESRIEGLRFRGVKGTTGTQDSFLKLFEGDHEKVRRLDQLVTEKMGFSKRFLVTGQTYTRKQDAQVLAALAGIGQSAHKFGSDIRLLQFMKEVEEPFEKSQVGSSAMPYKRNPMRSERVCALARYLISLESNLEYTAATQWMERTLDDSANRRIVIPEAFLAADAILEICLNVASNLVVNEAMVEANLRRELPFMAMEEVLMAAVKAGGNRQELHEKIREYSLKAGREVKSGRPNPLLDWVCKDPAFGLSQKRLDELLDPKRFVGRAPEQVEEFVEQEVQPALEPYAKQLNLTGEVRV